MSLLIPGRVSVWYGDGVANGNPIVVPGILEGDVLLGIIAWTAASGEPAPVATATFGVVDGEVESASVTTANKRLCIIYLQAAES